MAAGAGPGRAQARGMNPGFADEVVEYLDALLDDSPAAAAADEAAQPVEASIAAAADPLAEQASGAAAQPEAAAAPTAEAAAQPEPAPAPAPALAPTPAPAAVAAPPPPPPASEPTPMSLASPVPAAPASAPPLAPAPPASSPIAQASRWLRVVVGRDSYALELLRVQEVVRVVPIVAMRGAQPAVLGVMNLRGRIVPVFDLGVWLGTGQVEPGELSRIVVVERDDELIGVLVSAVEDVVTLGRDRIEPPLQGSAPGAILGVDRVGATPTVLFDAYALYG